MSIPSPGKMPWAQAIVGPLAGATCLWQDVDGLHVAPAPESPPPTSILWGWRDNCLLRVRLDGDATFIAVHDISDAEGTADPQRPSSTTIPWSLGDDRIAASHGRGPSADDGGVGATYEQTVVQGTEGAGPITFVRPKLKAGPVRSAADG
jgi:hypothetical protein